MQTNADHHYRSTSTVTRNRVMGIFEWPHFQQVCIVGVFDLRHTECLQNYARAWGAARCEPERSALYMYYAPAGN